MVITLIKKRTVFLKLKYDTLKNISPNTLEQNLFIYF